MGMAFQTAAGMASNGFARQDAQALRAVYQQLLEDIAFSYDEPKYQLAMLSYALSKVVSKPRFWRAHKQNRYWEETRRMLAEMEMQAREGRMKEARRILSQILERVETAEEQDPRFVRGLVLKARIKSASTFYASGLSLGRAAELSGLDKREILSYAGQTRMNERLSGTISVAARLRSLKSLMEK
ncbi:Uncharacterised protein [uncultured archaeon]|nr:Uncharacterised protein [uncultured archaeon]